MENQKWRLEYSGKQRLFHICYADEPPRPFDWRVIKKEITTEVACDFTEYAFDNLLNGNASCNWRQMRKKLCKWLGN